MPNLHYRTVRCVDLDANRLHDPAYEDRITSLWKLNRAEVPELRIIDDELWQAVKMRQGKIADKYVNVTQAIRVAQSNRLNDLRRPKALFSGLVHCGVCGGPCSLRGQDRYACSARVTNGSCARANRQNSVHCNGSTPLATMNAPQGQPIWVAGHYHLKHR